MSLEMQISSSLLLTLANKRQTLFGGFFSEIMLESWGCGLYTSLYGTLLAASHSACVVYTKTIIHLSAGENGGYLPPLW